MKLQINRQTLLSYRHPSRWRRKGRNTEERWDTGEDRCREGKVEVEEVESFRSQQGLRSKLRSSEFRGQPGALPTCGGATRSQRSAGTTEGKGHRRPASRTSRRCSGSPALRFPAGSPFDDITALSSCHQVLVTRKKVNLRMKVFSIFWWTNVTTVEKKCHLIAQYFIWTVTTSLLVIVEGFHVKSWKQMQVLTLTIYKYCHFVKDWRYFKSTGTLLLRGCSPPTHGTVMDCF